MSVPLDPQMMWKAINDSFLNHVNVIVNAWGKYDLDTLSLLSDADYNQRRRAIGVVVRVLMNCTQREIKILHDIDEAQYYIDRTYVKKKAGKTTNKETGEEVQKYRRECIDKTEREKWINLQLGSFRLQKHNDAIKTQAKAALALFRRMGLVEAFEAYEEQAYDILGVEKRGITQAKMKIKDAEKEKKEKKKSAKDRILDRFRGESKDGVLPEKANASGKD